MTLRVALCLSLLVSLAVCQSAPETAPQVAVKAQACDDTALKACQKSFHDLTAAKQKDTDEAAAQLKSLRDQVAKAQSEIKMAETHLKNVKDETKKEVDAAKLSAANWESRYNDQLKELNNLRKQLGDVVNEKDQFESKLTKAEAEVQTLRKSQIKNVEVDGLRSQIAALTEEKAKLTAQVQELQESLKKQSAEKVMLQKKVDWAAHEKTLMMRGMMEQEDAKKDEEIKFTEKVQSLTTEIDQLKKELETVRAAEALRASTCWFATMKKYLVAGINAIARGIAFLTERSIAYGSQLINMTTTKFQSELNTAKAYATLYYVRLSGHFMKYVHPYTVRPFMREVLPRLTTGFEYMTQVYYSRVAPLVEKHVMPQINTYVMPYWSQYVQPYLERLMKNMSEGYEAFVSEMVSAQPSLKTYLPTTSCGKIGICVAVAVVISLVLRSLCRLCCCKRFCKKMSKTQRKKAKKDSKKTA